MTGRILVGVDGSDGSLRALGWAAQAAAVRGVVIDAVTVCRGAGDGMAEKCQARARARLSRAVAAIASRYPKVGIQFLILQGEPAEALCQRARQADLLVVGARGHGTFSGLMLGSVASKCARHSPSPIVIVPKPQLDQLGQVPPSTGRIVVGVDMSEGSRHALQWAVDEAVRRHWSVEAATIWTRSYDYGSEDYWPVDKEAQKNARVALDHAIEDVAGTSAPVDIEPVVLEGDPAQKLCEVSAGADLLVVGCRGRGGFTGLLLGSVASKCARHSRRPVVIMHHHPNTPVGLG